MQLSLIQRLVCKGQTQRKLGTQSHRSKGLGPYDSGIAGQGPRSVGHTPSRLVPRIAPCGTWVSIDPTSAADASSAHIRFVASLLAAEIARSARNGITEHTNNIPAGNESSATHDAARAQAAPANSERARRTVLAAVLIGLPAFATAQSAAAPPGLLSRPSSFAASAVATGSGGVDQTVTRERRVAVNLQHLDPRSARVPTPLSVELFDGQMLTLDPEGVEQRGPGNYTWKGKVRGYGSSQAILTVVDGQIAGTITYHDTGARKSATFRIQSGPGGEPSLREIDPNAFPPDHPADPVRRLPPQSSSQPAGDVTGQSLTGDATTGAGDSAGTVDVMVVYSKQTAAAAGTAIGAQIQQAIDSANAAYANSGITTRLRLVHSAAVNYDESGDFNTDLESPDDRGSTATWTKSRRCATPTARTS